MREINRVYIGDTGNEGKPTPQPLQHEVMNQSFQTDVRTSWGLSVVYIYLSERRDMRANQDHDHCNMRTWTNHFKQFNAPPPFLTPRIFPLNQLYFRTVTFAIWTRPCSKGLLPRRAHPPYRRLCATRVSNCWQVWYVVLIERECVQQ